MEACKIMTDETLQTGTTGFGARLRSAREQSHLSIKEAASRLHLNPNIIEILEGESFENAPPATFMRGYLKSYARMLDFNEQEVTIALEKMGLNAKPAITPPSPILLRTNNFYQTERYTHWATYIVVFLLIVMVATWWNSHSSMDLKNTLARTITAAQQQPANPPVATATAPATETAATIAQPAPTTATADTTTTVATTPAAPTTPTPDTATTAQATTPDNTVASGTTAPAATSGQASVTPPSALTTPPVAANTPAVSGATATPPIPEIPSVTAQTTLSAPDMAEEEKPVKHHRRQSDDDEDGNSASVPEPGLE